MRRAPLSFVLSQVAPRQALIGATGGLGTRACHETQSSARSDGAASFLVWRFRSSLTQAAHPRANVCISKPH